MPTKEEKDPGTGNDHSLPTSADINALSERIDKLEKAAKRPPAPSRKKKEEK